jgi:hypothetical protein
VKEDTARWWCWRGGRAGKIFGAGQRAAYVRIEMWWRRRPGRANLDHDSTTCIYVCIYLPLRSERMAAGALLGVDVTYQTRRDLAMVSPQCESHPLVQPPRTTRTPFICRRATRARKMPLRHGVCARLLDSCCHQTSGDGVFRRHHGANVTTPRSQPAFVRPPSLYDHNTCTQYNRALVFLDRIHISPERSRVWLDMISQGRLAPQPTHIDIASQSWPGPSCPPWRLAVRSGVYSVGP